MEGKASDYFGAELWAVQPVTVYYGRDFSRIYKTVNKGEFVGKIYSYTTFNGNVWWELEDGKFVPHAENVFNKDKITESLWKQEAERQAQIEKAAQDRIDKNNPLANFGEGLGEFFEKFGIYAGIGVGLIILILILKR